MTTNTQTLPKRLPFFPPFYRQAAVTAALAGWADWLFFGHNIGITFAIFLAVLAAAVTMVNRVQVEPVQLVKAVSILGLALLPSVENLSYLSAGLGLAGIVSFVLILHRQFRQTLLAALHRVAKFIVRAPVRLPFDVCSVHKAAKRRNAAHNQRLGVSVWIVPIGFSLVFLMLFSNANPLIEKWLTEIDVSQLTDNFNGWRIVFWVVAILLCWPFIRFKAGRKWVVGPVVPNTMPAALEPDRHDLFGEPAIFRSLLLFNLLFVLQIGLDATYLLGGAELPDGMTYAQYAHRGAYPLICTALLAAAFVLFATRPGSQSEHSTRVRTLILAWTAQNVILVLFSIQRLGLYIEAYALTYWRYAAFIWMGLVLIGLVLIVAKLLRARSNRWLIEMNLITLLAVLYVTSFVNVASVIAHYNVARSLGDGDHRLDANYLNELGIYAIPAMDRVGTSSKSPRIDGRRHTNNLSSKRALVTARNRLAQSVSWQKQDWRLWSLRRYRLQRYLDTAGLTRVPNSASSPER
ncbi:MAG: DUF4173 domain-containing protein [Rhizobiales bacterium]|nr:DUF4173 domain-containing protein [Hyphomicrobiales bacterium]